MPTVKNIIFDLGNVLYDIDFTKMYNGFKNLGIRNFESQFTLNESDPLYFELEKGFVDAATFCDRFRSLNHIDISNQNIITSWNALLIGFRSNSIHWIKENQDRYQMFLYSNTNQIHYDHFISEFTRDVANYPFESLFKKPYYSHKMGMRKPDPASFIFILNQEGLKAEETLFIDDSEPNIVSAASVGLKVLHLKSGMLLENEIQAYL